jgi:enamine deaminase RidA (YjgF/YER057c/UK114 family)
MRSVNPSGFSIPGISQAIIAEPGQLVFVSGQVPFGRDGQLVSNELQSQLQQVFENLTATLSAAGATFDQVVRLTIYVRDYDPSQLEVIRSVRDRFIQRACPPASALIGVAALFLPGVLVEIDAIAVLSATRSA